MAFLKRKFAFDFSSADNCFASSGVRYRIMRKRFRSAFFSGVKERGEESTELVVDPIIYKAAKPSVWNQTQNRIKIFIRGTTAGRFGLLTNMDNRTYGTIPKPTIRASVINITT